LYPIGKTWLCVALCGFGGGEKANDQSFVCVPREQLLRKGQNGTSGGIRGHKWATQTGLFDFLLPFIVKPSSGRLSDGQTSPYAVKPEGL